MKYEGTGVVFEEIADLVQLFSRTACSDNPGRGFGLTIGAAVMTLADLIFRLLTDNWSRHSQNPRGPDDKTRAEHTECRCRSKLYLLSFIVSWTEGRQRT